MARILEFLTINLAVSDLDQVVDKYRAMGLKPHPPNHMPDPPAQITDVSVPLGLRSATFPSSRRPIPPSTVARFIEKRGEGAYSIALRVDNLTEIMEEWSAAGIEWILPKPYEFPPGTPVRAIPAGSTDRQLGKAVVHERRAVRGLRTPGKHPPLRG